MIKFANDELQSGMLVSEDNILMLILTLLCAVQTYFYKL